MTEISAKVILDSVSPTGKRITTILCRYPRFIHAEVMTHRVFSRNASSSRAIPFLKMLKLVRKHMAAPIHWGKNQPGMQASVELEGFASAWAKFIWYVTGHLVLTMAWLMSFSGVHKQVINRMIEPWSHINVQITSTEWSNFLALRLHKDAQPEIYDLAWEIQRVLKESKPVLLQEGQWHLPWIRVGEQKRWVLNDDELLLVSTARSARLSYMTHGDQSIDAYKDLKLGRRLRDVKHLSPFEHAATPKEGVNDNFDGWQSYRNKMSA